MRNNRNVTKISRRVAVLRTVVLVATGLYAALDTEDVWIHRASGKRR